MEQEKALSQAFSFQASHLRLTKFLENTVSCVRKLNLCKVAELSSNHTNIAWQCYYLTPVVSNTTYPQITPFLSFYVLVKVLHTRTSKKFFSQGGGTRKEPEREGRGEIAGEGGGIQKSRGRGEREFCHTLEITSALPALASSLVTGMTRCA